MLLPHVWMNSASSGVLHVSHPRQPSPTPQHYLGYRHRSAVSALRTSVAKYFPLALVPPVESHPALWWNWSILPLTTYISWLCSFQTWLLASRIYDQPNILYYILLPNFLLLQPRIWKPFFTCAVWISSKQKDWF